MVVANMAIFRAYTEFRRALQVQSVVIDLGIDVFISRLYQPQGLKRRSWGRRLFASIVRRTLGRQKIKGSFPAQFRRTLERLGPTYVKLGQILSLRDDMLPERITKELRKLQSQVPPISFAAVKNVIETEFNMPLHMIYESFDEEPIAAASLAQAHMAKLRGGQKVVVKVQRPAILKLITDDINIMRRLALIMEKIPGLRDYRPAHFVEEFADYTMRELDFNQEGKHADQFRVNFADDPLIIFPEIYWDYTSRRVLTMEYIDGIKPDDRQKIKSMGIDGKKLAAMGAGAVMKMLFVDGFFHGDPHPGNMLIVGRNRICLIDLGMIGSFSEETRSNMFLYYYYMVIKEFEHATRYLVNLTYPGPKADIVGFRKELAEAIKGWSGAGFKDYSLGKLIFQTMYIGARHQLYFHGDLVLSSKAIITIEAVGAILDPEMDLSEVSRPFMQKVFQEQFSPLRIGKSIVKSFPEYMDFLEALPNSILNTVNMLTSGKLQVELAEPEKEKIKRPSYVVPALASFSFLSGIFLLVSDSAPGPVVTSISSLAGLPVLGLAALGASAFFMAFSWFKNRTSE